MSERILIADDEPLLRENLCQFLRDAGFDVDGVGDGQQAWDALEVRDYDILVTDLRMPRMDGIALLRLVVAKLPQTATLVMTAYASVETAVQALRLGAHDYILKPIVFEDLLQKVGNIVRVGNLRREVRRLRTLVNAEGDFEGIVGESAAIREVFDLVQRVGPTATTVLITGESGTGKELVARALHARSAVSERPFVPVNVAAIPGEMLESQLFGHARGAFTGALRERDGLLRTAHGGTVFLDEIGELSVGHQAKLLRALESAEVLPVGADRPVSVSFRLLAATNQRLEERVEQGLFRADLFYRLNVFRVALPPLRARAEDIGPLTRHFLRLHGKRLGRPVVGVSHAAMRLLSTYGWPGNVRELSNVIERAIILSNSELLEPVHLPAEIRTAEPRPLALREAVAAAEATHIRWVLALASGDRERAAELLQVDRATLYRRLKKHGIR